MVLSVAFFDLTEEQVAAIEEGKVICKSFLLKDVSNYIISDIHSWNKKMLRSDCEIQTPTSSLINRGEMP